MKSQSKTNRDRLQPITLGAVLTVLCLSAPAAYSFERGRGGGGGFQRGEGHFGSSGMGSIHGSGGGYRGSNRSTEGAGRARRRAVTPSSRGPLHVRRIGKPAAARIRASANKPPRLITLCQCKSII